MTLYLYKGLPQLWLRISESFLCLSIWVMHVCCFLTVEDVFPRTFRFVILKYNICGHKELLSNLRTKTARYMLLLEKTGVNNFRLLKKDTLGNSRPPLFIPQQYRYLLVTLFVPKKNSLCHQYFESLNDQKFLITRARLPSEPQAGYI